MESLDQILGRNEHFIFARTMFGDRLQDPSGRVNHLLVPLLENLRRPIDDTGSVFVSGVTKFCAQTTQNMLFKAEVIEEEHTERFEVKSVVMVQRKSGEGIGMVHVFHGDEVSPSSNTVMEVRNQLDQILFRVDQSSAVNDPNKEHSVEFKCIKIEEGDKTEIGSFWEEEQINKKFNLKFSSTLKIHEKALILVAAHFLHQQKFLDNDPFPEPHPQEHSVYDLSIVSRPEEVKKPAEKIPTQTKKPVVRIETTENSIQPAAAAAASQEWDTSDLGFFDRNCGPILYWFCWGFAVLVTIGIAVIILTAVKII